jgi:hypothetical protein
MSFSSAEYMLNGALSLTFLKVLASGICGFRYRYAAARMRTAPQHIALVDHIMIEPKRRIGRILNL